LQPGDIIVGANRRPVQNIAAMKQIAQGSRELLLNIQRGDEGFVLLLR
jgi:serine protease Do/serine protease DegQ